MWLYFLTILAIILFVFILPNPSVKGFIGEQIVRLYIGKTREGKQYVINNLIISLDNNKSAQIDHIVINSKGIWVFETKNYKGLIFGNDSQHEWTQVLCHGKVKNHFYNPIKQNQTHVKAVQSILSSMNLSDDIFHSYVIFVQRNIHNLRSSYVLAPYQIHFRFRASIPSSISLEQMKEAYEILLKTKEAQISLQSHLANIQHTKNMIDNNICPRCGKNLILRQGRAGCFYGCSGYPSCRFVKRL